MNTNPSGGKTDKTEQIKKTISNFELMYNELKSDYK